MVKKLFYLGLWVAVYLRIDSVIDSVLVHRYFVVFFIRCVHPSSNVEVGNVQGVCINSM